MAMRSNKYQVFVFLGLISLTVIIGCTHKVIDKNYLFGKFKNDHTSMGRTIASASVEFDMDRTFVKENLNDGMIFTNAKGEIIDCNALLTRQEEFNGKSYLRYNISEVSQLQCPQVRAMKTKRPWIVTKTQWSNEDELGYQKFVNEMGKSKCNTADKCLSGPSNILRDEEDMLNVYYTDCADLPYYLRAYYAYKKQLPMSFVLEIAQNVFTPEQQLDIERTRNSYIEKGETDKLEKYDKLLQDLRYSRNGNQPISRFNIPNSSGVQRDFSIVAPQIVNIISSGFLRMTSAPEGGLVQPDFYSPKINRESIVPGTVLYNASGHVAVIYDITAKGEVLFMDSHPDNSLSRGAFNLDYTVLNPKYGANFKNFRPFSILSPGIRNGQIVSGSIRFSTDDQIPQYSLEQYKGDTTDANGKPVFKLKPTDTVSARFHDWVKTRLSGGSYRLDPILEMQNEVNSLCLAAQDRNIAVEEAVNNKIYLQSHPETLPQNIYGAEGTWESYSTPGKDIRFRNKILGISDMAKDWLTRYRGRDPLVIYNGVDLKADLIYAYKQAAANCKIVYKNSSGQSVAISLEEVTSRASSISFDPYMCPEIRWGAKSASELASCTNDASKNEWYSLTQFLRNILEKDTSAVHGYSLPQLRQMATNKEVNNSSTDLKYNVVNRLQGL